MGLNEATRALERGEGLALLLLCRWGWRTGCMCFIKSVWIYYYRTEISSDIPTGLIKPPHHPTNKQTHKPTNTPKPPQNSDVKPLSLLDPPATLCHLRHVPVFVLPKATAALGAALGLKRVAALGFRKRALVGHGKEEVWGGAPDADADAGVEGGGNGDGEGLGEVRAQVASFLEFVLAKREFMTNSPLLPPVASEEEG